MKKGGRERKKWNKKKKSWKISRKFHPAKWMNRVSYSETKKKNYVAQEDSKVDLITPCQACQSEARSQQIVDDDSECLVASSKSISWIHVEEKRGTITCWIYVESFFLFGFMESKGNARRERAMSSIKWIFFSTSRIVGKNHNTMISYFYYFFVSACFVLLQLAIFSCCSRVDILFSFFCFDKFFLVKYLLLFFLCYFKLFFILSSISNHQHKTNFFWHFFSFFALKLSCWICTSLLLFFFSLIHNFALFFK